MPYPTGETLSSRLVGWRLLLPDNPWVVQCLLGALGDLTFSDSWEQEGDTTPDQAANAFQVGVESLMPYPDLIGMIFLWTAPLSSYPDGVLPCDGTLYLETEYPDLYAVLGNFYSQVGDPGGTFRVPDLRGRTAIGVGQGSGLSERPYGAQIGAEQAQLSVNELPNHTHVDAGHTHSEGTALAAVINGGLEAPAAAAVPSVGVTGVGYANLQSTGDGNPFSIMPPSLALRYVVVCGVKNA